MKLRNLLNKNDLRKKQEFFIKSLEGIGDVLVFETKRKKNKRVLEGLKRLESIVKALFDIKTKDPDKFERLLFAQEFYDLYDKDKVNAQLNLSVRPERYLLSFYAGINQISRVHDAAIEVKNQEISRFATYHLVWLLAHISEEPGNELFVEQLLKYLSDIMVRAIDNQDSSAYSASTRWYTNIVFGSHREKSFDISYLPLYDKYFFSSIRYIISKEQTHLFEALITSLIDGIHIPLYERGEIWNYGHLILHEDFQKYDEIDKANGIERRINELANSEEDIDTVEKLDSWLERFGQLKSIFEPLFNEEQEKEASKIEAKIKEYVTSLYKYNNLLEIVFGIGAYCLSKNKPAFIKYLWEYQQPPDSDSKWIGHDIVPVTINSLLSFYFKTGLYELKFDFWEGHHGSEIYYKRYFLLLLARIMQSFRPNAEGRYTEIDSYNLPSLHIHRLSEITSSVNDLIEAADALKDETGLLEELGFDIKQIEEVFGNKLKPFLESLKVKAEERINVIQKDQLISPKKIEEFKKLVVESFNDVAIVRNIFKHYKLYKDKTNIVPEGNKQKYGIGIVDDKAAFFEEWHVHYMGWGDNYGRSIARDEDSIFISSIVDQCKKVKVDDFETILDEFDNPSDVIILANNLSLYSFFKNMSSFKPKWHKDIQNLGVKGFEGWYLFENNTIPVFEVYSKGSDNQIMILDKTKIGKIIQYSPIDPEDINGSIENVFYINVQAYSENETLMSRYLEKPPEWLVKVGDIGRQKEYLRTRVLVEIFERFEYQKPENFYGYIFKIKE